MIRITVDNSKEFSLIESAMDSPELRSEEYQLHYANSKAVKPGEILGSGRAHNKGANGDDAAKL